MGQVLVRATQAEAAEASNNSRWMSPLRTKHFLDEKTKGLPGLLVTQQSANSGGLWGVMDGAMIEFLGDTAYLFGGWAGAPTNADWPSGTVTNLVYRTLDFGVTWSKIRDHNLTPDATHFIPCHFSPHCVHNVSGTDYIYLTGGDPSSEGATPAAYMHSEVRRTTDGITWQRMDSVTPGWDGLSLAALGSLNGNLYLAGGHLTPGGIPDLVVGTAKNEVWRSTDHGATWTSLGNAGWAARQPQDRLALHNGKLWVVGGGKYDNDNNLRVFYNDVWSFDGTTWTEVLADGLAPWPARFYANVFSCDGWLYVSRGTDRAGNRSDTWRSRDGVKWYQVDLGAGFIPSHADGLGVHSTGFLQAAGNGRFASEVNTNSPTFFVTPKDELLSDSVIRIAQEIAESTPTEYAGIISEGYTEGTSPRSVTPGDNAKLFQVASPHYTGAEESVQIVGYYGFSAGETVVYVGGGFAADKNAARQVSVFVGDTGTSLIGKEAARFRSTRADVKTPVVFGSTEGQWSVVTASTPKLGVLAGYHYGSDGTLTDVLSIGSYNYGTNANQLLIGGGLGSHYAVTEILVYTAANGTTAIGNLHARITDAGQAFAKKAAFGTNVVPTVVDLDVVGSRILIGCDELTEHSRYTGNQLALVIGANFHGNTTVLLQGYGTNPAFYLDWGGGNAAHKAVTLHRFWASVTPNSGFGTEMMHIDSNVTADETGMLVLANGSMKRVSLGAADSGGTGFRSLRVPN